MAEINYMITEISTADMEGKAHWPRDQQLAGKHDGPLLPMDTLSAGNRDSRAFEDSRSSTSTSTCS